MKKRINKENLFVLTSFVMCFAFVGFVCMVLPAVKISSNALSSASVKIDGIVAVFGGESKLNDLVLFNFKFNLLSLIGYLLPLVGCVLCYFAFKKLNLMLYYVTAVLCIVGGGLTLFESVIFRSINNISEVLNVSILLGPIIGGVSSILAGLVSIGSSQIFK